MQPTTNDAATNFDLTTNSWTSHKNWDPMNNSDWQTEIPSPQCLLRIKRLMSNNYLEEEKKMKPSK